jgi:hypothetical protein
VVGKPKHLIVLFEDDPLRAKTIERTISKHVGSAFRVLTFQPSQDAQSTGPFEDRLFRELTTKRLNSAVLYVSDRDLSRIRTYVGLSEAAVSRAADRFGIPIILYAQGTSAQILARNSSPGDGRIVLKRGQPTDQAKEAARVAKGFALVASGLRSAIKNRRSSQSPAALAATIMGRPHFSDRVAQYALGDQKTFADVQTFAEDNDEAVKHRIQVRLIGTWIYDSIIRFPGLILNRVAAASYLDISVEEFKSNAKVQSLFKSTLYKGPFADRTDPLWWRPDLDDLLIKNEATTGRDLVKKSLNIAVRACKCSINAKLSAGYFCMITLKPISESESQGGLSWFPPGADVARVSKRELEELRPWLALY